MVSARDNTRPTPCPVYTFDIRLAKLGVGYQASPRCPPASIGDRKCCAPATNRECRMSDTQLTNKLSPRDTVRFRCPMCHAGMKVLHVVPGKTRLRALDFKMYGMRGCP
jgi:hypothetical protein